MYPDTIFLGMGLYDICIAIGVLAVLLCADRLCVKKGFSLGLQKLVIIAIVGAVVIGFFGAIIFQAFYDWLDTGVFSLKAGMTFYGGFIFGVGGYLLFWFVISKPFGVYQEARLRTRDVADMAGCLVPLAHGFGRLGCLFAGCCHGNLTDAWYGITMWVEVEGVWQWAKVVPVQLFESMFLFALAAIAFWIYFKRNGEKNKRIPILPTYFIAYGIWRFFIEFLRGDERGSSPIPFLTPSQLTAVILIAVGVGYFMIWFMHKKKLTEDCDDEKNGSDASI